MASGMPKPGHCHSIRVPKQPVPGKRPPDKGVLSGGQGDDCSERPHGTKARTLTQFAIGTTVPTLTSRSCRRRALSRQRAAAHHISNNFTGEDFALNRFGRRSQQWPEILFDPRHQLLG